MPIIDLPPEALPTPHATTADYIAYTGYESIPPDIDRKLVRASEVVDSYVVTAYDTDADDTLVATDPAVANALRDSTCAVVEAWESGDEVGDSTVGGLESGPGREPTLSSLPIRARRHLAEADLI